MRKKIAKILRVQRAKSGFSQEVMSQKLGWKRSNYARNELTGVISAENLIKFLLVTDIKKSELHDFLAECKDAMINENNRVHIENLIKDGLV